MVKIIVVEGLDGSGKETQVSLLKESLTQQGFNVITFSYPEYESSSGKLIYEMLHSEKGLTLDAYECSVLFAVNRMYSSILRVYLEEKADDTHNTIILLDRYVSSNGIYQGSKFNSVQQRGQFFNWLTNLEYNSFRLPKEDLLLYLDMPISESQKLLDSRYKLVYLVEENNPTPGVLPVKDNYEKDIEFLIKVKDTATEYLKYISNHSAGVLTTEVKQISCVDAQGGLQTKEEIHLKLLNTIESWLKPDNIIDEVYTFKGRPDSKNQYGMWRNEALDKIPLGLDIWNHFNPLQEKYKDSLRMIQRVRYGDNVEEISEQINSLKMNSVAVCVKIETLNTVVKVVDKICDLDILVKVIKGDDNSLRYTENIIFSKVYQGLPLEALNLTKLRYQLRHSPNFTKLSKVIITIDPVTPAGSLLETSYF